MSSPSTVCISSWGVYFSLTAFKAHSDLESYLFLHAHKHFPPSLSLSFSFLSCFISLVFYIFILGNRKEPNKERKSKMSSPATSSQSLSSPRASSVASSNVFVINALEKIAASKEIRRNKSLKEAVDVASSKEKPSSFYYKLMTTFFLYRHVEE